MRCDVCSDRCACACVAKILMCVCLFNGQLRLWALLTVNTQCFLYSFDVCQNVHTIFLKGPVTKNVDLLTIY